jgi:hypothetical protein
VHHILKEFCLLEKREKTFKESSFPLPQTPSPFFKPFCGIHIFDKSKT